MKKYRVIEDGTTLSFGIRCDDSYWRMTDEIISENNMADETLLPQVRP